MAGGKELLKGAVRLGSEVADDIMGLVMYSPSLKAARKLPQAKGTYQQLRQMLLKGGAKEDELTWSGFDRAFKDRKGTISRDEIEAYLAKNTDLIDEVSDTAPGLLSESSKLRDGDLVDQYIEQNLDNEIDYYRNDWLPERLRYEYQQLKDLSEEERADLAAALGLDDEEMAGLDGNMWVMDGDVYSEDDAIERLGDPEDMARDSLYESARSMSENELRSYVFGDEAVADMADTSDVQYADYFTPGARDYTEKRYILNPDNPQTELRYRNGLGGHWNEDNVVAHARVGEFPTTSGGRAYHVGEVQSDWGQKARKSSENGVLATPDQEMDLSGKRDAVRALDDSRFALQVALPSTEFGADPTLMRRYSINTASDWNRYNRAKAGEEIPTMRASNADPDAMALWLRGIVPKEGELPLDYSGSPDVSFAALPETQGLLDEIDRARANYERLSDIENNTAPNGPYIDATSKWVDMVLRRNMLDAINSGSNYMTIGSPQMVKAMTYGQDAGQTAFYGDIVPRRLKEVATKIDKNAQISPVGIQTGDGTKSVLGLHLTPEFVEAARKKGIPYWMLIGGTAGGLAMGQPSRAQAQQPQTGILNFLEGR